MFDGALARTALAVGGVSILQSIGIGLSFALFIIICHNQMTNGNDIRINMIEARLTDFRHPQRFIESEDVVHIFDGRQNRQVGYFIPEAIADDFALFLADYENNKKLALLKRIAQAQKIDAIGDGAVADGLG